MARRLVLAVFSTLVALAVVAFAGAGTGPEAAAKRVVEEFVWIDAGDHRIPGILTTAKARGSKAERPAALLIHGFGSHKDEVGDMYKRLASQLARRGYSSLRIDFAGSGDNPLPFTANTYDGMVQDSGVALDYLVALPSTDDDRIGLVGFSLGSRIAMTVAGTDDRIKALASWSGAAANGTENFQFFFDVYYPIAQAEGHVVVDLGFRTVDLSLAWFETIRASRALDQIAAYRNPLLGIAGENDTVVDPVWSRELIRHSGSFDATLRIIPGADHIFNVLTPDQTNANMVLKLTTAWFNDKL
jgi:hypothetical protein